MKQLLTKAFSKPLKIFVVILATICSLASSFVILQLLLPNVVYLPGFKLYSFSNQLFNAPLPEKTTFIEKTTSGYIFEHNRSGNYHEYAAVLLIESELSLDELIAYYDSATSTFLTANDLIEAIKNPNHFNRTDYFLYYDVSPVTKPPYFLGFPYSDYYGEDIPIRFKHLKSNLAEPDYTNLYYVAIHDNSDKWGQME